MLLQKTKENRYRHYKGGIYYILGEGYFDTRYSNLHRKKKFLFEAKYEPTGEIVKIYEGESGDYDFTAVFKDRDCDVDLEFVQDVILYVSEEGGLNWVRLKDEFEGFNEQGIKRFILANT